MPAFHESWAPLFDQFIFTDIDALYKDNQVYPSKEDIFKVFQLPVNDIKVVLLGQDPYHGPGQAHGLSFSVPNGVKVPPSLRNIYKELESEFPERSYTFTTGNLERWLYEEKIFLLNAALTVANGKPGIHMKIWEEFTNSAIEFISEQNNSCVFLLLGNFAKEKEIFINNTNNNNNKKIIKGVHPSPLSAHNGFFGSNIFKQVEDALGRQINWQN